MANVMVPKEFFVKERRMYANWQFAFWRELFQNSTDAGSSNIRISLVDKGDKLIGIEFEDNGSGMTRETLETVYFRLGASTKNDGSTVGGFGRARILTCFSMKNYTIHTQNSLVQGDGGSYEIAEADHRRGCLIQLEIEDERFGTLKDALEEYLSYSQLHCLVTINGERWTAWSHRRQLTRTLDVGGSSFANVYVNKSAANSRLLVRVNGTVMYSQSIRAKAQVIVEVDPRLSREVLTANRDGMHTKYAHILNNFVEELAVDTMSALASKLKRKNSTIRGRGLIFSMNRKDEQKRKEQKAADIAARSVADQDTVVATGIGQGSVRLSGSRGSVSSDVRVAEVTGARLEDLIDTNAARDAIFDRAFPPRSRLGEKHAHNLPDLFIIDETDNEEVRKVIDRYNPEGWVICERQGVQYSKGRDLYKLIMLWKIACQSAIDALMEAHSNIPQVVWGLGWIFSDEAEASCKPIEGGHALLLNPVNKEGKMAYSLSSKEDRKKLMALAKHEVAHTVVDWHNEQFAGILTDIDVKFDEKEVFRKMKDTIAENN